MVYVYSKGTRFCSSTFVGDEKTAILNGYIAVSDEDYDLLRKHHLAWSKGVLVEATSDEIEAYDTSTVEKNTVDAYAAERQELMVLLRNSDYRVLKYIEGHIGEDEYASIKAERQTWRLRINELEALMKARTEDKV